MQAWQAAGAIFHSCCGLRWTAPTTQAQLMVLQSRFILLREGYDGGRLLLNFERCRRRVERISAPLWLTLFTCWALQSAS